ncbi:hypothetical protein [Actinokineospora inagensis]|nr:hypothetical protein [Actinokineospora inagensis]
MDAYVVDGELSADLAPFGVGVAPCGEFSVEGVEVADAAVEALP